MRYLYPLLSHCRDIRMIEYTHTITYKIPIHYEKISMLLPRINLYRGYLCITFNKIH